MPKLTIDNRTVEVNAGTTVLEAAKQLGIWIPHFCYHPALGQVGACRLCAVKLLDGPVKGIQMSCMLPAQDGMVVSTTDPEAMAMRRYVIEWLMLNHPHDCPVCDEGGECLLQDYTVAGGHGVRRYTGTKRTHVNQYLGPHIEHEMNRCIQCYRCVRFYQEYAGGSDFGVMGSAGRVYYGRFQDGALESPFSGNLVDICPTGVFTDKTARFRARYWDYDLAPSVCPHCSLGCNTMPAARYRELLKTIARENQEVNGWFICDRGRFENGAVNAPDRPRTPRLDGRDVPWDEAMDALVQRLSAFLELHGAGALALVGSPRLSHEGALLLARLATTLGAGQLCYFTTTAEAAHARAVTAHLQAGRSASQEEVRQADLVTVWGDPLAEAPMLALAIRQAWRRGGKVVVVGEDKAPDWTRAIGIEVSCAATLDQVSLTEARQPVLICAGTGVDPATVAAATGTARLAFTFTGPNGCGAALVSREYQACSLAETLADNRIKGIIALEADLPAELPDSIALLAVADWRPTPAGTRAEIFFPVTPWVEMDGTYINNEGRAQRFARVMQPGLPIRGLDPALHPPRQHRSQPPGGEPRPAWQILAGLLELLGEESPVTPYQGQWHDLSDLPPDGPGRRICDGA